MSDLPRFLSIFEAVCQTVAYAHARGVIHRDLKPSNVMVGAFGEVQVMDWGLAKVLPRGDAADRTPQDSHEIDVMTIRSGSGTDASRAGSILGTPSYMAPEQARGELEQVDERADVFGLGAILCEILTGKPPFVGRDRDEIRGRAECGDLAEALQRLQNSAADTELITLCFDCLATEPTARPRNAGEVAHRITAHLAGVQDRLRQADLARVQAETRMAEERKRRRMTVALAGSVLVIAGLAGGGWTFLARQRQERAVRFNRSFGEAEGAYAEASRVGDDLARWLAARDAAHAVEGLLADAPDEQTRRHVSEFARDVTQAAAAAEDDQNLLAKLVDIRSAEADDPDGSETDAAYADAFREAGIDVDSLPAAEAGTKIKARPAPVALALVAALDDWALRRRKSRPKQQEAWRHLAAAARAADPDPRRDRLRELWEQLDLKAKLEPLRKTAQEADPESWPVQSLILLAGALYDAGDQDAAAALLRRAQMRYPGDIWINYDLGFYLDSVHPQRTEEVIRYYSVARGLRPETAHSLAHVLQSRGQGDEAAAVFQDLVRLRPGDGRHRACYALLLKERGLNTSAQNEFDRATADLRVLTQLKPDNPEVHNRLGNALSDQGKLDGAIAEFRTALRLDPDFANFHNNLGGALGKQGKLDEAIAEYRTALRLKPGFAEAHYGLGTALGLEGKLDEAIAEYRTALRLKPGYAEAHNNFGIALGDQGKLDEAVAEFRESLRLKPDNAPARSNLGGALHRQGKLDAAIAEFRESLRLKPDFAAAHSNLGGALKDQGKCDEAIAEVREALRLKPDYADAHNSLGGALRAQGKLNEAIAEYHETLRLNPDYAAAHCNLGLALQQQGQFREALEELRSGHALGSKRPGWPYTSDQWLLQAEQLVELGNRLSKILSGQNQPASASEGVQLGYMSYNKRHFASSARLFADAFRADPKLSDDMKVQNRYNATCAAALAGCGQGKDEPPLDEPARARWRKQAIDWLKADLAFWTKQVETGPPQARAAVVPTLQHWKADTDLAGIREGSAMARLPEDEQKACRALWAEVEVVLKRAQSR